MTALGGATDRFGQESADDLIVWQLSSANNRPLARSTRAYGSFEDANDAATAIRAHAGQITYRSLKLTSRSEYVWIGSLDSQSVLISARIYSTVRDARDSIVVVSGALPDATVESAARALTRGAR
ncbi:hypothetical protein [Microbacterium sp. SLBN-146]|uniref:hypothetical protein n=1 Tax=Microbacterium sp. SLBN-146 TaxID=2768457 RepID=UPI00114E4184|nr:hypothetical protein [Microbacterium sp. SLBN-146]